MFLPLVMVRAGAPDLLLRQPAHIMAIFAAIRFD
jgi:hypothetical protein